MKKTALTFALALIFLAPLISALDWPEFKFDQGNGGYTPTLSPCNSYLLWKFKTGGFVETNPAVWQSMIYFGSWDGRVYCLWAVNGTHIWNYSTGANSNPGSGLAIVNEVVYFGSKNSNVYALNATDGTLKWSKTLGGAIVLSAPQLVGNLLYIGSDDNNLYALNLNSGSVNWTYATGGSTGSSSPAYADGRVFIGSQDKYIYAVNATNGSQLWSYQTGGGIGNGCCMVTNGIVYGGSADKKLYALNASTGSLIWSYRTGGAVDSNPSYAFGMVFIGSHDSNIYALNATTGAVAWTAPANQAIMNSNTAIGGDGRLVAGGGSNIVFGINATNGASLWNFSCGKDSVGGAALSNGMTWFGSDDTYMYAIGGDPACGNGAGFLYNSNLSIWDDTDTQNITSGQQVHFYANYTFENGTAIPSSDPYNATCQISFNISGNWTAPANMSYNATSGLYYYNRSFGPPGTYPYNITAVANSATPQSALDSATILPAANLTSNVSVGKGSYSGCSTIYYRVRLFNSTDQLMNESFNLTITDPTDVTRATVSNAFPNSGTGVYKGNYSASSTAIDGPWLLKAIIQGTIKGTCGFGVYH